MQENYTFASVLISVFISPAQKIYFQPFKLNRAREIYHPLNPI